MGLPPIFLDRQKAYPHMKFGNYIDLSPPVCRKRALPTRLFRFAIFVIAMMIAALACADTETRTMVNPLMTKSYITRPLSPQYQIEKNGSVVLRLCFNSSCGRTEMLTFSAADMKKVKEQLAHCPGQDLYDRLQRVRIAVWQMEVLAQKYEPLLANDLEVNDREYGVDGRMDCVDNASNTANFLMILTDLGQLPSWQVEASSVRWPFDFDSVHWTAVLKDKVTGKQWSVDSWFRPNGNLPFVLPLNIWKDDETQGWLPPYDTLNPYPRFSNEFCRK